MRNKLTGEGSVGYNIFIPSSRAIYFLHIFSNIKNNRGVLESNPSGDSSYVFYFSARTESKTRSMKRGTFRQLGKMFSGEKTSF